jgi:hypothetical protein
MARITRPRSPPTSPPDLERSVRTLRALLADIWETCDGRADRYCAFVAAAERNLPNGVVH